MQVIKDKDKSQDRHRALKAAYALFLAK